jgi:hypothetical protein
MYPVLAGNVRIDELSPHAESDPVVQPLGGRIEKGEVSQMTSPLPDDTALVY